MTLRNGAELIQEHTIFLQLFNFSNHQFSAKYPISFAKHHHTTVPEEEHHRSLVKRTKDLGWRTATVARKKPSSNRTIQRSIQVVFNIIHPLLIL
jgi:predicted fused transcriptional regulator/phosphomethylpyrimidine kinase